MEILAGIIGAIAGAAITALVELRINARKRRDEAGQRHAAVYLSFLATMRDAVKTRSAQHGLEEQLNRLNQELQVSDESLKEANARLDQAHVAAEEAKELLERVKARPGTPEMKRALRDQGAEAVQRAQRAMERVDEVLPEREQLEERRRELLEAGQKLKTEHDELERQVEERSRAGRAALDQLVLTATPAIEQPASLLVQAVAAYQDAPSRENRDVYEEAEWVYLKAVRVETR